jgi:hypothetical protein
MHRQIPNTVGATHFTEWHTVSIPLTGLDVLRSVGIESRELGLSGTGRTSIAIRNVRFAAATGIDQAIHRAGASGHVVVPAGYTSALTQRSWVDKPAGVTVEDRRPGRQHTTGAGGMVWADDFFLDHTGTDYQARFVTADRLGGLIDSIRCTGEQPGFREEGGTLVGAGVTYDIVFRLTLADPSAAV